MRIPQPVDTDGPRSKGDPILPQWVAFSDRPDVACSRIQEGDGLMQRTVATWEEFRQVWDGVLNFLMVGECVPFSFDMPPVEQVIDEIRRDPDARIWQGARGDSLDQTDISEAFRKLPLQQAVDAQFQMSHFKLSNFYAPGKLFHCFEGGSDKLQARNFALFSFTCAF